MLVYCLTVVGALLAPHVGHRVQLIARLSDHRGDVAYNDFFRLALRNAPRSAR